MHYIISDSSLTTRGRCYAAESLRKTEEILRGVEGQNQILTWKFGNQSEFHIQHRPYKAESIHL